MLLIGQGWLLLGDNLRLWSHFSVHFDVVLPFVRHIVFMENGFDGALWNTGFAVNTFFWMDVDHLLAFVEALYRTDDNTIGIAAANARLSNYVSHEPCLSYL
jgi:hypothetical protein